MFRFGRKINASLLALSISLLPRFTAPALAQEATGEPVEQAQVLTGTTIVDVAHLPDATLSVAGDLTNAGVLYLVSSNSAVTSANLVANNIINTTGSTITTVLPSGGLPGYSGLVTNLNLSLFAASSIVNAGQIASAGSLSLTAGNSIINSLPAGVTGPTPIMQAVDNLNVIANQVTNAGIMASSTASLNFGSLTPHDIIVQNTTGLLQALNGAVNVRGADFSEKMNFALLGGDVLANELNIFSGSGIVSVNVNDLQAIVNASAGEGHFVASSGQLNIGSLAFSGDPTIFNRTGDVLIDSSLVFAGQPLAIVASGDIRSTVPGVSISTSSASGDAGNITLVAGANFTASDPNITDPFAPVTLTVTGGSATGGSIILDGVNGVSQLEAKSTSFNGKGGNITLVAFQGATPDSGQIKLPPSLTVATGGTGTGGNGDVTIMAGQVQYSQDVSSIVVGDIDTRGGTGSGGNIFLATGQPSSSMTLVNGNPQAPPGAPTTFDTNSGITTGDLLSPGKNITVHSGGYLSLENVISDGIGAANGGSISIIQKRSGYYVVSPGADAIHGVLSANSGAIGGSGGSISLEFTGILETDASTTMSVSSVNGAGGSISLQSSLLNLTTPSFLNVDATAGNGGSVSLRGNSINLPAGGSISANAAGGNYNGGVIHLDGNSFFFTGTGALQLSANGTGNGNGGTIEILGSSATDVYLDPAGGFILSATGGSAGSNGGDAGTINLQGDNIAVFPGGLNAASLGNNGRGMNFNADASFIFYSDGSITANGSTNGSGGDINIRAEAILVDGHFLAQGNGTGNGGNININIGSSFGTVTLGEVQPASSFISGNISADGGALGAGGHVTLAADGIIRAPFSSTGLVSATTGVGDGGSVELLSTGAFNLGNGFPLNVSASGGDFDGGTIRIMTGTSAYVHAFGWQANGSGNGNGGTIDIFAGSISPFFLSATGGSLGSSSGNGGTIIVKSMTGPISGNPWDFQVRPLGLNGNGGTIELRGTMVNFNGNLSVDGTGYGDGGRVSIQVTSAPDFILGTSAIFPNAYVSGYITANSGSSQGNGGRIELSSISGYSSLGNYLQVSSVLGEGGTIILQGGQLRTQNLTMDASGTTAGGMIALGDVPVILAGHLHLNTSSTSGPGGAVILGDTNLPFDTRTLNIHNNSFGISISTAGETSGGTVSLYALNSNIFVDPTALSTTGTGVNSDGGHVQIGSEQPVWGPNSIFVNGSLQLDGRGTGAGGSVDVFLNGGNFEVGSSVSSQGTNGFISAGSATGSGGRIQIDSYGGNLAIDPSLLNVQSVSGNAGQIILKTGSPFGDGTLTFTNNVLNANGTGPAGNGGLIDLSAILNLPVGATLSAAASGSGNGGTVRVNQLAGPLVVGGAPGELSIVATGGSIGSSSGNGGTLDLSSNSVTVNESFLAAGPLGANGNGANFKINSQNQISWQGSINANAAGNGSGGNVQLIYGSNQFSIGTNAGSYVSGTITAQAAGSGPGGNILLVATNGGNVLNDTLVDASSFAGQPGTVEFRNSNSVTGNGSVGGILSPTSVVNLPGQSGPLLVGGPAITQTVITAPRVEILAGQGLFAQDITINTAHLTNNGVIGGYWTGGVIPPANSILIQNPTGLEVDGTGTMVGSVQFNGGSGAVNVNQGAIIGPYTGTGALGVTITLGSPLFTSTALNQGTIPLSQDASIRLSTSLSLPESGSSSTALSTDLVKISIRLQDKDTEARTNLVFTVLSSDDSELYSDADTEIEEKGGQIYLSKGKTLVDAKSSRTVVTPSGTLQIPKDSAHIVEVRPNGVVRVVSLAGNSPAIFLKDSTGSEQFKCERGQELIVASKDISEEELIPIDGCDRSFVEATITKSGTQQMKARVKVKQVASRDLLIAGVLVHIGNSRKPSRLAANIQRSIDSESTPVLAEKSDKGLFYVADGTRVKLSGKKIDLSSGEAVVFPKERSSVSTPFGELILHGRQVATIENNIDVFRIRVCTGSQAAEMRVGNKLFLLNAGEELTLTKRADQSKLSDGVARRRTLVTKISKDLYAMTSEFSLSGYLSSPACILKQSRLDGQRMMVEGKILKSAAALQMVAANHGPYMPPGALTRKTGH